MKYVIASLVAVGLIGGSQVVTYGQYIQVVETSGLADTNDEARETMKRLKTRGYCSGLRQGVGETGRGARTDIVPVGDCQYAP